MKIVKLLPLALSLMLFSPAFAETTEASALLQITVPNYTEITTTYTTTPLTPNIAANYASMTTPGVAIPFKIINNVNGKSVYLSATAQTGSGTATPALDLNTDIANLKIVLTNKSHMPTDTAVTDALKSTPAKASNPNAIAFPLTCSNENFGYVASSGTTPTSLTPTVDGTKLKFILTNGQYEPTFNLGTANVAETFSAHDEAGTYEATLMLSVTGS